RPLPGTEGAHLPFWSPDSRSVGFVASPYVGGPPRAIEGSKLKRIDLASGVILTLSDATLSYPGSWSKDNVILFTPSAGGLFRVSALGGTPSPVTTIAPASSEFAHVAPCFLPDAHHFLYTAIGLNRTTPPVVYVGNLNDSRERKRIPAVDSQAI